MQHQPIHGSTKCAHLIGREAIYFTSIIPDNDTSKRGLNQEMLIRFCVGDIVGVSIIDSIPHCYTKKGQSQLMWCPFYIEKNVLNRGKTQEMWLLLYIEDKI